MPRRTSTKPKPVSPPVRPPEQEVWSPKLFGKQWDVFNSYKRIQLVCGSRRSAKTWACVHKICRHLFETPGARVGFFAKSVKVAKDGGVWQDLLDIAIPEWLAAGIGFEFTTFDQNGIAGPKQDAQTRTAYFRIRNMYGGESECKLFSIEHDHEVASKVKGKRFSMIFFSELSMFKDKKIMTVTLPSLRMAHLTPKEGEPDIYHQWLADTNPDEELGDRSWFYEVWYKDRLDPNFKWKNFQSNLGLIEMFLHENPFTTPEQIEELEASCHGDECLYDSYVRGVHGEGSAKRDRFFTGIFDPAVHVIGNDQDDTNQIDVHEDTKLLMTGWDLGGRNHAAVILEPWFRDVVDVKGTTVRACFSVLDELLVLGEQITLDDFTTEFMKRMKAIEDRWERNPPFRWEHWSDDSATTVWRPTTGSYDYMEVQAASNGAITLQGVVKPWHSVASRVRIVKMLLRQKRLWISSRCVATIDMIRNLRRGDTEKEYVLNDKHKHIFDALTYPIFMRVCDELIDNSVPRSTSAGVEENLDYIGVG